MHDTTSNILVAVVILLAATLLIGNRLGYRFAGGAGYTTSQEPQITVDGGYKVYSLGGNTVFLDVRSEVELIDSHAGNEKLRFLTGRLLADGDIELTAHEVAVAVHGQTTIVHYSWLNKMDVLVLDGTADIRQGSYTSTVTAGKAVSLDTLPPYDAIAPTSINIEASNVKAFYDWALQ